MYKEANEFNRVAFPVFCVICLLFYFLTGCSDSYHREVLSCSVTDTDTGYIINCPDGTEIQVEDKEETITSIITYVPEERKCGKKDKEELNNGN